MKVYGLNACVAVLSRRLDEVERLFLLDERRTELAPYLRELARLRRPYRIVPREELARVAGGVHHEGVCLVAADPRLPTLPELVAAPAAPLIYLDGVTNPHNLGAILRVSAHFAARALITSTEISLSAAAIRVAEGAAERVPVLALDDPPFALAQLRAAGHRVVIADPRAEASVFLEPAAERTVYVLGAERTGVSPTVLRMADRKVRIDGTGAVESLNVATACAVLLAEHLRQHPELLAARRG